MNSTLPDLAQAAAAVVGFAFFFLAPGFLLAHLANINHFRQRSRSEQLLWSVALSLPLAIELCTLLGRVLASHAILSLFALLAAFALILFFRAGTRHPPHPTPTITKYLYALMALFSVYVLLAQVDVQIGHHLFVSTAISDWGVRIPMVNAAMRSGVPPINGLSAFTGNAPPLRYYYFWYVVCADLARLLHVPANAALIASSVWSGFALIATAFLALRYLVGISERIREHCALLLLVGAVLGLDILPTALTILSPHLHPYPEMEYWHQDRTPSFLGGNLYAPHHFAAFACALIGFLVLVLTLRPNNTAAPSKPTPWPQLLLAAVFAALCFSAAAGTAIFVAFAFIFVCLIWAIDLLLAQQWRTLAALAACGLLALLFSHAYLHELSSNAGAGSGFALLRWRNDDFVALQFAKHHILAAHPKLSRLARQPFDLLLDFFDLGFYVCVLAHRIRKDLRRPLTPPERALWALALGAAIPFFCFSSVATSGPNDLGVDASFLLRLTLQLWAVQWIYEFWQDRRSLYLASPLRRAGLAFAAILFVLGLTAQLYQAASERLYYAIMESTRIHKQQDWLTRDHLSERLYNIRSAYAQMDRLIPPSAPDTNAIQFNPVAVMQPALSLYTDHQIAAYDTGCGTAFGGDYPACIPVFQRLLSFYGNTPAGVANAPAGNLLQDNAAPITATTADLDSLCHDLHLAAVVAESTDSIWFRKDSWVWTTPPLVANDTVRILPCPR